MEENIAQIIYPILHSKFFVAAVAIALAVLINKLVINRFLKYTSIKLQKKIPDTAPQFKTFFGVLRTLINGILYFFLIIFLLNIFFDISLSALVTATGALGVVAGIGAQSTINDLICGCIFLLEGQYAVGDLVTIEDFTGYVTGMTIRVTKIKNFEDDILIIPNGNIKKVINHSKNDKTVFIDVKVSYDEDTQNVIDIINRTLLSYSINDITKPPSVLGVAELGDLSFTVRIQAFCVNGAQYSVQREIMKLITDELNRNNIKRPLNNIKESKKDES